MNRYDDALAETFARIETLEARSERFAAHPTLNTRVAGVDAEIAQLRATIPTLRGTAKLAREMWG